MDLFFLDILYPCLWSARLEQSRAKASVTHQAFGVLPDDDHVHRFALHSRYTGYRSNVGIQVQVFPQSDDGG